MNHHALDERHELSRALRGTPPQAPTLCGDWTAALLTAHLVQRERSLTEALGRLPVQRLRRRAERRLAELVRERPYQQLVAEFDDGPPRLSPWAFAPVRESVNLLEYVIHHEDVRRAIPDVAPRKLPIGRQRAIWQRLRLGAPLTMRSVPVGVRLVWSGHGEILARRARHDAAQVTVTGDPVELALVAFGRQRVAHVDYDGTAEDVDVVRGARIAI